MIASVYMIVCPTERLARVVLASPGCGPLPGKEQQQSAKETDVQTTDTCSSDKFTPAVFKKRSGSGLGGVGVMAVGLVPLLPAPGGVAGTAS